MDWVWSHSVAVHLPDRIFQFENFARTKKRVLRREEEEGALVGHVIVTLAALTRHLYYTAWLVYYRSHQQCSQEFCRYTSSCSVRSTASWTVSLCRVPGCLPLPPGDLQPTAA